MLYAQFSHCSLHLLAILYHHALQRRAQYDKSLITIFSTVSPSVIVWLQAVYCQKSKPKYTVKKVSDFPRLYPGCHKPNSPWAGIIKFLPARESFVSDIPAGGRKITYVFYSVPRACWVYTQHCWRISCPRLPHLVAYSTYIPSQG